MDSKESGTNKTNPFLSISIHFRLLDNSRSNTCTCARRCTFRWFDRFLNL